MADGSGPQIWQFLAILVSGVIGAGSAIIAPQLLEGKKQEADKKRRKAAKFEELVTTIYEHKHWLTAARRVYFFASDEEVPLSPMSKVIAISSTHFPQFEEAIDRVDIAADKYVLCMMEAKRDRKKIDTAELVERFEVAWKEYLDGLHALLNELKAFAKTEFQ